MQIEILSNDQMTELQQFEDLILRERATASSIEDKFQELTSKYQLTFQEGAHYIREYDYLSKHCADPEKLKLIVFQHCLSIALIDFYILKQDWEVVQKSAIRFRSAIAVPSLGRICTILKFAMPTVRLDSRLFATLATNRLESHLKLVNLDDKERAIAFADLLGSRKVNLGAITVDQNFLAYLVKHRLSITTHSLLGIVDKAFARMDTESPSWLDDHLSTRREWSEKRVRDSHGSAGLFNYEAWYTPKTRRDFPVTHPFSEKKLGFPVLKSNTSNTFAYLMSCSAINRFFQNTIREDLKLPLVGEGWINESRIHRLLCDFFGEDNVQREYSPKWLGRQRIDFFIAKHNLAIEWNGAQHYRPIEHFGGQQAFEESKRRDERKAQLCARKKIRLLVFPDTTSDADVLRVIADTISKSSKSKGA